MQDGERAGPDGALSPRAVGFFRVVTAWPRTVAAVALAAAVVCAYAATGLRKDTSAEAFMPADHPAVLYRAKVKEIFGLKDPMVVAVVNPTDEGVFTPHALALVSWLTEAVVRVPGIDPDRVASLATEKAISGTSDGMLVEPFFSEPPTTRAEAERIRDAVFGSPLYLGGLVARDGRATLIVAELVDERRGQEVYEALRALAAKAPTDGETIYVAGEGAVVGQLGSYVDTDARRLTPVAALLISLALFLAYRTWRALLLPMTVVVVTIAAALGAMAAAGTPFYFVTNALPVILVGISVADSIHILGRYYEERAERPAASQRDLVIRAMAGMWRPVTVTSLTSMAGFLGIFLASYMPPMRSFGLYAMLGVGVAWAFSLVVLPALLVLFRPQSSPAFRTGADGRNGVVPDRFGRAMAALGAGLGRRPGIVLTVAGLVAAGGVVGAAGLEVDAARIEAFRRSEPIYIANAAINRLMDGTNYLDIVVTTPEPEDLFRPGNLRRIAGLQEFLETLPHVRGTTSIADYVKQMNRAVNEGRPEAYRLPDEADLAAQYFLLYTLGGDPTDFADLVDYEYRLANVRATLDSGLYSDERAVVEAAEDYLRNRFDVPGLSGQLTGRVAIDYHWMKDLTGSHFRSVAIALLAVWLMASLSFRSLMAGLLAVAPVVLSVLLVYAVMGAGGIWLGVGTAMIAAIAIGIGVDFAVHTIDRLIASIHDEGRSLDQALADLYTSTGRALLFNFIAVFFGFGVMVVSQVPDLTRFGVLVAAAVWASFLASVTVLPALVVSLRPAFLGLGRRSGEGARVDPCRRTEE